MDILVQIYLNFWTETQDNVQYKALYCIYEGICRLKPPDWFSLPGIQRKLEECSKNDSNYFYFAKGKGYNNQFKIDKYINQV